MKKVKKIIILFLILSCSFAFGPPVDDATSQQTITTTRISGQTRYETAKAISDQYNQEKVHNVILCNGNGFADALSASVLAHQKDAPIMLVDSIVDGSKEAFDYVTQHLDSSGTVYIIGGTGIISREFETRLNNLGFNNIVRIAGIDRYDTKSPITNNPFINAFNHIETLTYDGSGQAVHPSVIDFKTEYDIETWGGFRYWMALTPFPNFNSAFENPSILVSQDGLNWINPPSIKNPLASKPLGSFRNHNNSDPELLYDPDQNSLILYWRECRENVFERIWFKTISSDYKQSDKILCFEKAWDYNESCLVLSPTVWRKSAKEWYMWTTDGRSEMLLYTSIDGITWSSGQPCSAPWESWNGGYIPWHITAKPSHREKRIDFLIAGWPINGTMKDSQLFYATAPMSHPKELSMPLLGSLLRPGAGDQWDNGYIYRSSFVLEPGDSSKFRIWYSACSKKKAWHIGYTEGTLYNH